MEAPSGLMQRCNTLTALGGATMDMRPEPDDIFEPIGRDEQRRAILQAANQHHNNRLVVVSNKKDQPVWPPQRVLASFDVGPMVQASRIPLGGRCVLVCDLLANQVLFRSINLETLSYGMQFPVPGTFPQVWPIGLDVDDSGRYGLFAWARDDWPAICIYDSRRRVTRYLDCSDLRDRDVNDIRWTAQSTEYLECHDIVNDEAVVLTISNNRVLWPNPKNIEPEPPASPEPPLVRRPSRRAKVDEHSLNSSTLPE